MDHQREQAATGASLIAPAFSTSGKSSTRNILGILSLEYIDSVSMSDIRAAKKIHWQKLLTLRGHVPLQWAMLPERGQRYIGHPENVDANFKRASRLIAWLERCQGARRTYPEV
jgi:hypothetical protein